jgi:GntR family transcriptional regulator / MocR family aminotransferase
MFSALRLGYLVLPESLAEPIAAAEATADAGTGSIMRLALADFIEQGHFERHLHRTIKRNRVLRAALLDAIARHFGDRAELSGANTGLHLSRGLKGAMDERFGPSRPKRGRSASVSIPLRPTT